MEPWGRWRRSEFSPEITWFKGATETRKNKEFQKFNHKGTHKRRL